MTAVLVVTATGTKALLDASASATLRILAEVVRLLRRPVAAESTPLLAWATIGLAVSSLLLLGKVMPVVAVISISVVRGVVGGVVARRGAERAAGLLGRGLRGRGGKGVEGSLRGRGLLGKRVQRLLGPILSARLSKAAELLALRGNGLRRRSSALRTWNLSYRNVNVCAVGNICPGVLTSSSLRSLSRSAGLRHGRQGSARMRYGGISRRLSASLRFFPIAIDVLLSATQVESTELHGSAINLTVSRHANSLFLIKDAALVAGGTGRALGRRLHG